MDLLRPVRTRVIAEAERLGGRHDDPEVYDGEAGDPGLAGGPGSLSWELHGDLGVLGVAGPAAVITQLLHPSVMAGAETHSSYRTQPLRRSRTTLGYVLRTTFGSTPAATAIIEQVKRIHGHVRGERPDGVAYEALDPKLITWVHACIPWAIMRAYERHRRPLTTREKDRYLTEQAPIGRMGGADWVPETVADLEEWIERMRPELAVNEQTRSFIEFLAEGAMGAEPRAGERSVRWMFLRSSMSLMPEWAQSLTGLRHESRLERRLVTQLEQWRVDVARWAIPVPQCKRMAMARASRSAPAPGERQSGASDRALSL